MIGTLTVWQTGMSRYGHRWSSITASSASNCGSVTTWRIPWIVSGTSTGGYSCPRSHIVRIRTILRPNSVRVYLPPISCSSVKLANLPSTAALSRALDESGHSFFALSSGITWSTIRKFMSPIRVCTGSGRTFIMSTLMKRGQRLSKSHCIRRNCVPMALKYSACSASAASPFARSKRLSCTIWNAAPAVASVSLKKSSSRNIGTGPSSPSAVTSGCSVIISYCSAVNGSRPAIWSSLGAPTAWNMAPKSNCTASAANWRCSIRAVFGFA